MVALARPNSATAWLSPTLAAPVACGILLLALGLVGASSAGVGYGILLLSGLLLLAGTACFSLFILADRLDSEGLPRSAKWLLASGGWAYLIAVLALSGFYVHEAFAGRFSAKWIIFGPAALAALLVLDVGLYRSLVEKQRPTWLRYGHFISRDLIDRRAMRRTLIDEVILHRTLFAVSRFRWLRHTLIFWGFALMFGTELLAVVFREALPAFGFPDVYANASHPIHAAFKVAFDLTGLSVLLGCILALSWRFHVRGSELRKYSDTPTTLFLLFVVGTGFAMEAFQVSAAGRPAVMAFGFVGYCLSFLVPAASGRVTDAIWLVHVLAACGFIAYVPVWRLVHSCATPLGRLANSQKQMLAAKKQAILGGLAGRGGKT